MYIVAVTLCPIMVFEHTIFSRFVYNCEFFFIAMNMNHNG